MADSPDTRTSATLLGRLSDPSANQESWAEFVGRYGPMIYRWSSRWGLQEADAQDLTQSVLTRLLLRLRDFHYDPSKSFRAYLRTVARYALRDLLDERKRTGAGGGDTAQISLLGQVAAREDLARLLDEEFDRELLDEAIVRVKARVEPKTWEAFRLTAFEGLPGAEVADRLGLGVYAVFKAKNRVQKMLQETVALLDTGGPPPAIATKRPTP